MSTEIDAATFADERAVRLRLAFEAVYDRWMREIGDAHDAWNAGDLVEAAMTVLKDELL